MGSGLLPRSAERPGKFPVIVCPNWDRVFRIDGHYIEGKFFDGSDPYFENAVATPHNRVWLVLRETCVPKLGNRQAAHMAMERFAHRYARTKIRKLSDVAVALFASPK